MSARDPYVLGWIVMSHLGTVLQLSNYHDGPDGGLLLQGNRATLFIQKSDAMAAIKRSRQYASAKGHTWRCEKWRTLPIVKQIHIAGRKARAK